MSEYVLADKEDLTAIADAVRTSTGSTDTYSVSELSAAAVSTIEAGGGGADWNAAEGEPGHILNRTHWAESGMVDVLAETVVDTSEGQGIMSTAYTEFPTIGNTYTITYNGVNYECVCEYFEDDQGVAAALFGNGSVLGLPLETTDPFIVLLIVPESVSTAGYYGGVVPLDGSTSVTVSIKGRTEVVHKLDPKFYERTHWTEPRMVDIFTDLTVTELEPGAAQCMLTEIYPVEVGKDYKATYNGVEYDCKSAFLIEEGVEMAIVVGNIDAVQGTGDSGEPFVMMFVLPELVETVGFPGAVMLLDGSSSATISLAEYGEIVHKIPSKFYDPADWKANDYEAGHILNRPFGESGVIVLPETKGVFESIEGVAVATIDMPVPLIREQRYKVVVDGKEEFATALGSDIDTTVSLGDSGLLFGVPVTGESFAIWCFADSATAQIAIKDAVAGQSFTIQISTSELKQIEPKYIPESATTPYVLNLTNAKDLSGNDVVITSGGAGVNIAIRSVAPDPKEQAAIWRSARRQGLDVILAVDGGSARCIRLHAATFLFNHSENPSFDDINELWLIGWNHSAKVTARLDMSTTNNITHARTIYISHE